MGTNYYWIFKGESHHIGESSCGWVFNLHIYPDDGIHDLDDWRHLFEVGRIQDEYGGVITVDEMLETITERGAEYDLQRSSVVTGCIGHGDGTWDLWTGDFS